VALYIVLAPSLKRRPTYDIIGDLVFVENKDAFVQFVAVNLDKLPKHGPEEMNVRADVSWLRIGTLEP
jgi:hypothetical protein